MSSIKCIQNTANMHAHELMQSCKWLGVIGWADEKLKENGKDNNE